MSIAKRIHLFAAVAVAAVLAAAVAFPAAKRPTTARAASDKPVIDMYLIAGQSNAAGYSQVNCTGGDGVLHDVTNFDNSVWYAGQVDRNRQTGATKQDWLTFDQFKQTVKIGYGKGDIYIGPEFGMARVLQESYAGLPDRQPMIFKTACGGTPLCDVADDLYGNWYPRSLWQAGFTPNGTQSPTGVLYKLFLDNFTKVVGELKAQGYEVEVRAMIWSQGEADRHRLNDYKTALKAFIRDMREDLGVAIGGDKTTLEDMPFVLNEIAEDYGDRPADKLGKDMDALQNEMPNEMNEVYVVETGDMPLHDASGRVRGYDHYHFTCDDMDTLGQRLASVVAPGSQSTPKVKVRKTGYGTVLYGFNADLTECTITVTPAAGQYLSALTVDGETVPFEPSGAVYVKHIAEPSGETRIEVNATFSPLPECTLTYDYNADEVRMLSKQVTTVTQGDSVDVRVVARSGFVIGSVTFNGREIEGVDDTYTFTVTESGTVKVNSAAAPASSGPSDEGSGSGSGDTTDGGSGTTESGGCDCNGANASLAFALVGLLAASVIIIKIK